MGLTGKTDDQGGDDEPADRGLQDRSRPALTDVVILVLRALKLGDLLVAVPALRAIRRYWSGQQIVLATSGWLNPIVALTGCVDRLLPVRGLEPLPAVARFPDVAINLHGAGPQSNRILDDLRPARRLGHAGHGWPGPPWRIGLNERARWCRMLAAHGVPADPGDLHLNQPSTAGATSPAPDAVVVHVGASYGSKRWPAARFADVAGQLAADGHRVVLTGTTAEQWLAITGKTSDQLTAELREAAETAAKVDLALRAVAEAEQIECTDDDLDEELAHVAERVGEPVARVRAEFERGGNLAAVRSDVRKRKALDWLLERVEIVDEDGHAIDRADLEVSTASAPLEQSDETDTEAENDETESDAR